MIDNKRYKERICIISLVKMSLLLLFFIKTTKEDFPLCDTFSEENCETSGTCSWTQIGCRYNRCRIMGEYYCNLSERCSFVLGKCAVRCPMNASKELCNKLENECSYDETDPENPFCNHYNCSLKNQNNCGSAENCEVVNGKCEEKKCTGSEEKLCSGDLAYKCIFENGICRDKTCEDYGENECKYRKCFFDTNENKCIEKTCKSRCEFCSKDECKTTEDIKCFLNKENKCVKNVCEDIHMEAENPEDCKCKAPYKEYTVKDGKKCLEPLKMDIMLKADDL